MFLFIWLFSLKCKVMVKFHQRTKTMELFGCQENHPRTWNILFWTTFSAQHSCRCLQYPRDHCPSRNKHDRQTTAPRPKWSCPSFYRSRLSSNSRNDQEQTPLLAGSLPFLFEIVRHQLENQWVLFSFFVFVCLHVNWFSFHCFIIKIGAIVFGESFLRW